MLDISPAFHGTSVHDGLMSYWSFDCEHALCNAHHLRELPFVEEELKQEWAAKMKALFLLMKERVQQKITGGLRTQAGVEQVCRIRSYLSTLHKQGADLFHALHQTFLGQPVLPAF